MTTVLSVTSRTDMQALVGPAVGQTVFLSESTCEGLFECFAGTAPSDPQKGLYVPSNTSGYYYARVWDGVVGRPEWFGAKTGDGAFDNRPFFDACLALCPQMELAAADYYFPGTWKVTTSCRTIFGAGSGDRPGPSTRLVLNGIEARSSTVMQVGPNTASTKADTAYRIIMRDLQVIRDVEGNAATPPATGNVIDAAKGIVASYLLNCRFTNIVSIESPVGFHIFGAVDTDFDDCQANRDKAGSSATNDFFVGMLVGGSATNFGYAGANASLRINRANVSGANAQFTAPTGMRIFGYAADTFVNDFEMALMPYGIVIDGSGVTAGAAQGDIYINHPVLDGVSVAGIQLVNLNTGSSIDIVAPYIAPVGTGTALQLSFAVGAITITGGQVLASSNAVGFAADNSNGFVVAGTRIRDAKIPVSISNSGAFDVRPLIHNITIAASGAACTLAGNYRSVIAPIVKGSPAMFTQGIAMLGTGNNCMEVNLSGIDPGSFTTVSAANKLFFNGATVTTSTFGSDNVRSGVTG